jgi:hypothetical protein
MRNRRRIEAFLCLLVAVILLGGCASFHSPEGWLPKLQEIPSQAYGCWTEVDHAGDGQTITTSGELIAASSYRLFILNQSGVSEIGISSIKRMRLEIFKNPNMLGAWALLGTLSTLSHGYGMVASAPIWIIAGTAAAVAESNSGLIEFKGCPFENIRKYARFPQGLPEGIDLGSLKMKSSPHK